MIKDNYYVLEDFIYWYSKKKGINIVLKDPFMMCVLIEKWKIFEEEKWDKINKNCTLTHKDNGSKEGSSASINPLHSLTHSLMSRSIDITTCKRNFLSSITPFGSRDKANKWNMYYPYPYGKKNGISTHNRVNYKNINSSFLTELSKVPKKEGEPLPLLFQAIRHGVLVAYKIVPKKVKMLPMKMQKDMIKDLYLEFNEGNIDNIVNDIKMENAKGAYVCKKMQMNASLNFTRELIINAIISQGKLDEALNGETVNVTITSVALLSPYVSGGEAKMLDKQINAYEELSNHSDESGNKEIEIHIKDNIGNDVVIKVVPKIIYLNCGVNILYHQKIIFLEKFQKGVSTNINGNAIVFLQSELNKFSIDNENYQLATDLMGHIMNIQTNQSKYSNRYALPMCIVWLGFILGHTVSFNCKSGKDRTGILDALVKCYISYYDATNELLTPDFLHNYNDADAEIEGHIKKSIVNFLLHCGSFEVQGLVAGFRGYKIKLSLEPWLKKVFRNEEESLKNFLGGSRNVFPEKN